MLNGWETNRTLFTYSKTTNIFSALQKRAANSPTQHMCTFMPKGQNPKSLLARQTFLHTEEIGYQVSNFPCLEMSGLNLETGGRTSLMQNNVFIYVHAQESETDSVGFLHYKYYM